MQKIIKLESRQEVNPKTGSMITVYRKIIIKPSDPNYQEELIKRDAFYAEKDKNKIKSLC